MPKTQNFLHHTCDSKIVNWVRYDETTQTLFVSFKPKGSVYAYSDVPGHHFTNILTAKTREEAIGEEAPKSEGSYIGKHIVGPRKGPAPFVFRKLTPEEAEAI
jgi:hypothetical protein